MLLALGLISATEQHKDPGECVPHSAMWFAFLAQKIAAQLETHLWTLRFFVLRNPCHVGGGRGAGIQSITRVNGFLDMQSQGTYTAAQKHCDMTGGGRYPHTLRRCGAKKRTKSNFYM